MLSDSILVLQPVLSLVLCVVVDGDIGRSQGVKYYRAIYSYNPLMMSPNEGLEEEELTFHEGDIIKVSVYN